MEYFFNKETYLEQTYYHICLGDDLYAASIQEAIILGPIQFDELSGKAKFSARAVVIPACEYVTLVNVIDRAHRSFEEGELGDWEELVYKYSHTHHLKARFEMLENELTLKFLVKWHFAEDTKWNKLVAEGSKKPIDTSKLANKQWLQLKRGAYLQQRHVDVLQSQMVTILGLSFQQSPGLRGQVMGFVDIVMANEELKVFLSDKVYNSANMSYQSKMTILTYLLDELYKGQEGSNKNELLFLFSNKAMLVFALLNHYMKQFNYPSAEDLKF